MTFLLLSCTFAVIANDLDMLKNHIYRAEMVIRIDPERRYERLKDRLGTSGDDIPFGSIDAELDALSQKAMSWLSKEGAEPSTISERHAAGRRALDVALEPDGRSLMIVAHSLDEREARELAEATASDFADQRGTAVAGWLRERLAWRTEDHDRPAVLDLIAGSMRDAAKTHTRTSETLEALSAGDVTFADLATVEGSEETVKLLVERAVLQSRLGGTIDDDAEREALETAIGSLERQIDRELQRLAGRARDRAEELRGDANARPALADAVEEEAIEGTHDRTVFEMAEQDITTLLEESGPYVVTDAEADVSAVTGFNDRSLIVIGLASLSGALLIWPFLGPARYRPRPHRHRRLVADKQRANPDPAWPFGDLHSGETEGRRSRDDVERGHLFRPGFFDAPGHRSSPIDRLNKG